MFIWSSPSHGQVYLSDLMSLVKDMWVRSLPMIIYPTCDAGLCMHTLTRQAARILSEHLAITSGPGPITVWSTQKLSGALLHHQHSMAGSSGKLQAAPETLWQRVVGAGRRSETDGQVDQRKRQKTSSGSASAVRYENIAITKRDGRSGRSQASTVARPGKGGTTDLGQGSIIMYAPAAFSAKESTRLFQSLQVCVLSWNAASCA